MTNKEIKDLTYAIFVDGVVILVPLYLAVGMINFVGFVLTFMMIVILLVVIFAYDEALQITKQIKRDRLPYENTIWYRIYNTVTDIITIIVWYLAGWYTLVGLMILVKLIFMKMEDKNEA